MAKKILAQIALAIFINILILPATFAIGPMPDGATGSLEPDDPKAGGSGGSGGMASGAAGIGAGASDSEVGAAGTAAAELLSLANPFKDLEPCINEFEKKPDGTADPDKSGPDNGYVITIIEEPLNVETSGSTKSKDGKPPDNYVVRACFRNTFQYYNKDDRKFHSVPMLAASCSLDAQNLLENAELKEYQVKYSCKEVMVILTKGGTTAIYGYINLLYRWGAGMVGIIAVTVIIVSGIQISASGGDSEAIGSAKKRILQSIVGIAVLFLSSLILYTINPNFFTR